MKKVFNIDALGCNSCSSIMSILSGISDYQIDVLKCLVAYDVEAGIRDLLSSPSISQSSSPLSYELATTPTIFIPAL